MKTETSTVFFIVVHIVPALDWNQHSYRRKKEYHYLLTTTGKKIPLKPVQLPLACIDVAFIGNHRAAQDSGALYTLLQDLWAAHPDAEVVYADELQERTNPGLMIMVARALIQQLPVRLQRLLSRSNSLFTLHTLLPLI